ncbi:hypothetical protein BAE44_0008573 [Dichanthelium oligosanthes]|uniref:Uncharacterized protein n=1 Tax=Dichanthelium oligosanthes TaxID=888268 RepID=A0A1E5VZ65_9POAL|nr:hypothetical protein BAE44_0008573 [Dichanthelium oligosanthes]
MNAKQAILCCLLVVLMLQADYTSAGSCSLYLFSEIVCATLTMKIPFCKGWMCKSECWLQKKLRKTTLFEHKCIKGGIKGTCRCIVCKDIPIV